MKENVIKIEKAINLGNTIFLPNVKVIVCEVEIKNIKYISHSNYNEPLERREHFLKKHNSNQIFHCISNLDGYSSITKCHKSIGSF